MRFCSVPSVTRNMITIRALKCVLSRAYEARKALQLYANIRPVATYPSLQHLSPLKPKHLEGVNFVIFTRA